MIIKKKKDANAKLEKIHQREKMGILENKKIMILFYKQCL